MIPTDEQIKAEIEKQSPYLLKYFKGRNNVAVYMNPRWAGKILLLFDIKNRIESVNGDLGTLAEKMIQELETIPKVELKKIKVLTVPRYFLRPEYKKHIFNLLPSIEVLRIDISVYGKGENTVLEDLFVEEIIIWFGGLDTEKHKMDRLNFDYEKYWLKKIRMNDRNKLILFERKIELIIEFDGTEIIKEENVHQIRRKNGAIEISRFDKNSRETSREVIQIN